MGRLRAPGRFRRRAVPDRHHGARASILVMAFDTFIIGGNDNTDSGGFKGRPDRNVVTRPGRLPPAIL